MLQEPFQKTLALFKSKFLSFHHLFKAEWGFMFQEQSFRECKLWGADNVPGTNMPMSKFRTKLCIFPFQWLFASQCWQQLALKTLNMQD